MNKKQLRQLIDMAKRYAEIYESDDDIGFCGVDCNEVQLNTMGFAQLLDLRGRNKEYGFAVELRKHKGEIDLYTPYKLSVNIGGVTFFTIGDKQDFKDYDIHI
jgi:hypothetical protein